MKALSDKIYYAEKDILEIIKIDFDLINDTEWYQLYQHKIDKTIWRLDKWDKHQVQFFVRLSSIDNWTDFDDTELRIELLQKTRGTDMSRKCIWRECIRPSLNGLVYCEIHAYKEMGIRK
ncbi:MAG: hypothetical protein Q8909_07200 [Bacteroidota bacterium]|nr:hypothetical protein [Bacteroidota bacterium]